MDTSFLVSVKCLECGAPLNYPEGAYTFNCHFCGSVLRIKKKGIDLKYIIPCQLKHEDIKPIIYSLLRNDKNPAYRISSITGIKTIYKPFWYFKGMVCYCYITTNENNISAKTWYYSFQANTDFLTSFKTLSVRTEVLTIVPFNSEALKDEDEILPVLINRKEAHNYAKSIAGMNIQLETDMSLSTGLTLYKKFELIGEHLFIIYYPVVQIFCANSRGSLAFVMDGIGKSILKHEDEKKASTLTKKNLDTPYKIVLLAHRCKNCGYDLQARDFDIIFYCKNCHRLWLLKNGDYYQIKITIIETKDEGNLIYMPFWRFEITVTSKSTGMEIKTLEALSTIMKMGRYILRNEDKARPVRIYCPAFLTKNATALLKLAKRINIFQKPLNIVKKEDFPYDNVLNSSILDNDAEKMLGVILFSVIDRRDQKAIDFYKDFKINITKRELVWYPFEDKGNFLIDIFHQYNFPKKSMELALF